MRILVVAEKKKVALPIVAAFEERGISSAYVRISKIILVSKLGKTTLKTPTEDLSLYDGVFLQVRSSLAPFIEPLLEELWGQGYYVNAHKGSYFITFNEPYQFVALAQGDVPTPRTLTSGSGKNIERVSSQIAYPVVAKSFLGRNIQQSLVVNNRRELNSFVNSIKSDIDGFMLKEFIEGDVISCVVIGEKIVAIKRKYDGEHVVDLAMGNSYRPTENEKATAIKAAQVCGFSIARVDLVKGRVIKVEPTIDWRTFDAICSENLESHVAAFMEEQILSNGIRKKDIVAELKGMKKFFAKTIFARFFR